MSSSQDVKIPKGTFIQKIENKFNIELKSIFYIDDKLFFMFKNHVYPNKGIGLRINYFINSNDLHIRSINNYYYYQYYYYYFYGYFYYH